MELKESFKRVTVEDAKKNKARVEMEKQLADLANFIDQKTNEAVLNVLKELGYEAHENMTLEENQELEKQLQKDGYEISIETEQIESNYVVAVKISKKARVLYFDLNKNPQ